MNKSKIQRYELAVYLLIGLLALVLFLVGTFVITSGTLNGIILNLSSELLGVALIFFIVNRIFLLDGDDNSNQERILNRLSTEIGNIRKSLTNINKDITELTKKITTEIDKRQKQLLRAVENKFATETFKSHENLRQAIERELNSLASQHGSQSSTVERLVSLVEQSIQTMGSFQRLTIEEESKKMFAELLQNINQPTEELSNEVENLRQQVQQVQKLTALPVLRNQR
jgi:Skp family chaperone for outer membrane proteins